MSKIDKYSDYLVWAFLIGFIAIAIFKCSTTDYSQTEPPFVFDCDEALWDAEKFVKKYLKAPSTAKFANVSDEKCTTIAPNHFSIESYVDSENSFGAMLRQHYTCQIKYEDGKVKLINLRFRK